ncbi:MAG: hypothetical protein HZA51_05135 [Planctomycetes bacterium]|nr:hypothetical protein [Planctomycetota bacterium]
MVRRRNGFSTAVIAACLCPLAACVPDKPRLNSPPVGYSEPQHPMSEYFAYHNDQGMIHDLSLADIHFVPHTTELSATGQARLERYAELLATRGGTIHYDPTEKNEKIVKARIDAANEFLKQTSPGTKTITVALGIAGGRGMGSKEASLGKEVAKQPETRQRAYRLNVEGKSTSN